MTAGILILAFRFTGADDDKVDDWFNAEPLPEGNRPLGSRKRARWIGTNDPNLAVATYELDDAGGAGRSNPDPATAHRDLSAWSERASSMCQMVLRFEGELIGPTACQAPDNASGLLINAMSVEPEWEDEFNAWYDTEHIPALSAVPGTLSARRFRAREGTPRYLAMYHLASPDVQVSPEWKQAANTPWTERMRPRFRDHVRIVGKPHTPTIGRTSTP